MDNENELQDSPQPEQEQAPEQKPEPTLEDYQELAKKNKELYARAKKAEELAKKARLEPATTHTPAEDPQFKATIERLELKTDGYSADEVDFILRNGGRKALDDKWVKTAIDTMRQQAKAESAQVDTDSAKSDIEKKYSVDQLKGMSAADMEKILPKA